MLRPNLPAPRETVSKSDPQILEVLPHERMYSIQIGARLFKLSGASLSFDSPSYFTNYFLQHGNESEVLFIDRSPRVFEKICLHLQGYSIHVEDEYEYLYLYADSTYFHLDKLHSKLLDEGFFVNVGGKAFQIPKCIFLQQGNYPNYFSVIYDTLVSDPFLTNSELLRPPPLSPVTVQRCPALFDQLLQVLQGNHIEITSEIHRRDLINEAKYYSFFALEQQFIKVDISINPCSGREEVLVNFNDLKKEGLLNSSSNQSSSSVQYARPYIDMYSHRDLVLQIDSAEASLLINIDDSFVSLTIVGKTAKKLHDLLVVVSDDLMYELVNNKLPKLTLLVHMNQCCTYINGLEVQDDWISKLIDAKCDIAVTSPDAKYSSEFSTDLPPPLKRRTPPKVIAVRLLKSQWKVSVAGRNKIWMNGVLCDGVLDEPNFNKKRGFL
ncbi:hypothetical protein FOA43_002195 [Brettanomyces nanus]|uniref:Potassium channel tetramerisation-type BTB domain-containing protein n=1 Tax=Eeniella nana TaxID=13502 RepID=A0A875S514_EENNA|nr:uncharacterized protein FOA43_002195 [Brettanomyces nanus]QPG74859.1 hypothetical protein FOA43_002195 [Brettanomyces nanus]